MMKVLILILVQCMFSFFRTLNVRTVAKGHIYLTIITGVVVKSMWLFSAYLGVSAMIDQDFMMVAAFIFGGAFGDFLGIKLKI